MKNIVLVLFVLWILSMHFYLYVPALLCVALGAAFVSAASVTLVDWFYRRRNLTPAGINDHGSLGL